MSFKISKKLISIFVIVSLATIGLLSVSYLNNRYSYEEQSVQVASDGFEQTEKFKEDQDIASNESVIETKIDFLVSAISVRDGRAVLNMSNGGVTVVAKGDKVGSSNMEVVQITSDKLILRNIKNNDMYWVYSANSDGKSRFEKMTSVPDLGPMPKVVFPTNDNG